MTHMHHLHDSAQSDEVRSCKYSPAHFLTLPNADFDCSGSERNRAAAGALPAILLTLLVAHQQTHALDSKAWRMI